MLDVRRTIGRARLTIFRVSSRSGWSVHSGATVTSRVKAAVRGRHRYTLSRSAEIRTRDQRFSARVERPSMKAPACQAVAMGIIPGCSVRVERPSTDPCCTIAKSLAYVRRNAVVLSNSPAVLRGMLSWPYAVQGISFLGISFSPWQPVLFVCFRVLTMKRRCSRMISQTTRSRRQPRYEHITCRNGPLSDVRVLSRIDGLPSRSHPQLEQERKEVCV